MGLFSGIIDTITGKSGRQAQGDSIRAAEIAAGGQRESLDYLKEVEALPLELRNKYLPQYADIASGGQGQQDLIDSAKASPLYDAIMGGQQAGEQAILRNASATGGLRSGNASGALTDYGSQLENKALLTSYNQQLSGIQGLANMPLNTNNVANAMAAPARTQAQGIIAGSQARQDANQSLTNNLIGLGGAAFMAPAGTFSDIRLKDNIKYLGIDDGHKVYSWTWKKEAKEFGLKGDDTGVMAHEVAEYMPEAISTSGGYILVNYDMLTKRAA